MPLRRSNQIGGEYAACIFRSILIGIIPGEPTSRRSRAKWFWIELAWSDDSRSATECNFVWIWRKSGIPWRGSERDFAQFRQGAISQSSCHTFWISTSPQSKRYGTRTAKWRPAEIERSHARSHAMESRASAKSKRSYTRWHSVNRRTTRVQSKTILRDCGGN